MQINKEIPKRSIGLKESSLSGKFHSQKINDTILFESSLERDFIEIMEFDYNVWYYREQPVKIPYNQNGKTRYYYPDFLIHYRKDMTPAKNFKPMLCEIKYREELRLKWNELRPKFSAAIEFAKHKEWRFKILTENEIRSPFLTNAKFLLRYKNYKHINIKDFELLLKTIDSIGTSTPDELIKMTGATDLNRQAVLLFTLWYMIAEGYINCDLTKTLTMQTEIW